MTSRKTQRFLALTLAVILSVGLGVGPVHATGEKDGITWEELDPSDVNVRLFGNDATALKENEPPYKDTDVVRALIILNDTAPVSYSEMSQARQDTLVTAYAETMSIGQAITAANISRQALDGKKLDVVWSFEKIANAISVNVEYGRLQEIASVRGVKHVFLERRYEMLDEPNNLTSQQMTGADGVKSGATGYYGAGTSVAIIDTGLSVDHISFDAGAFEYALKEDAGNTDYDTYVEGLDLLTVEKINAVLDQLNVKDRNPDITAEELYRNMKVPFAFNYATGEGDVSHPEGDGNEHGSHVAGIAAANRYLPAERVYDIDGDRDFDVDDAQAIMDMAVKGQKVTNPAYTDLDNDGEVTAYDAYLMLSQNDAKYVSAADSVRVDGVAPEAQIVAMGVFGDEGGTYASDYIAALEDAITLGVDVSNLSLGSPIPDYSKSHGQAVYDEDDNPVASLDDWINGVFDAAVEAGMVVSISAGNSGNWADEDDAYGLMYADEGGVGNLGAPGSFTDAFTVASADNTGSTVMQQTVVTGADGARVTISAEDMSGAPVPWSSLDPNGLGTEYDFVFLGDPTKLLNGEEQEDYTVYAGDPDDFAGVDFKNKIAVVARGNGISFIDKHQNAEAAGAVAVIVFNNESGPVSGTVAGGDNGDGTVTEPTTAKIPVVGISMEDGLKLLNAAAKSDAGVISGKLKVINRVSVTQPEADASPKMSYFSSWGTTGDLKLKPEITAPGGAIMSVNGAKVNGVENTTGYELMSGTSMSSPHNAGLAALGVDYVTANNNEILNKAKVFVPTITAGALVQSLLMSTAVPLIENEEKQIEYSVRNQGAGLANIENAVHAKSFITVAGADTGKVKAELGARENGVFTFTFTVNNLTSDPVTYTLSDSILGQGTKTEDGHILATDEMVKLTDSTVTYDGTTDGKITVPANSKVEVTVIITTQSRADEGFINGYYVEGYIYLNDADGARAHSIPLLGWYGDWTAPSMYDVNSTTDLFYGSETRPSHIDASGIQNLKNLLAYAPYGIDEPYAYSGNIYNDSFENGYSDKKYIEERNSINTIDPVWELYGVFPTMIRSGIDFDLFVTGVTQDGKADLSKLYYEDEDGLGYDRSLSACFYYLEAGAWYDWTGSVGIPILWDMTDENGEPLANGEEFMVTLVTVPEYGAEEIDYEKEETEKVRSTDLTSYINNPGSTLHWTFTVDNEAPEVVDQGEDTFTVFSDGTLEFYVHDNRYVAAVIILDGTGSAALNYLYPDMSRPDTEERVRVDLSGYREQYGDKVTIAVCDYAGNETYYGVNLNGAGKGYGEFVGVQSDGWGGSAWVSFDADVDQNETSLFTAQLSNEITAAEYVNGMVYVQTEDARLYGIAYEDLIGEKVDLESSYITTLENVYTDLAYNYKDGMLYGITIYTDPRGDDYTDVFSIKITKDYPTDTAYTEDLIIDQGNVFGMTLSIDDDGNIYVIGSKVDQVDDEYVESETAYLFKSTPVESYGSYQYGPLTPVGDTEITYDYLQSATWDHNNEKLYWARFNFDEETYQLDSILYEVSTTDGKCTRTGTLSGETSGLMVPLTEESAQAEKHRNVPEFDRTVAAQPVLGTHNITLTPGSAQRLTVTFDPWYSSAKNVVWSTDDPGVATVDQNGVVTAVSGGTTTITVTNTEQDEYGDYPSDSCTVSVAAINMTIEGYTSAGTGVTGEVTNSMKFTLEIKDGKAKATIGSPVTANEENDYGLKLSSSVKIGNEIWASEWENNGIMYKIDENGEVQQWYEPIDGDVMYGLTYSDTTKKFTGAMNAYLFADIPMLPLNEKDHQDMLDSWVDAQGPYDSGMYTWHRIDLTEYLEAASGNLVTQDGVSGNMSAITIAGLTSMPGGHHAVQESYVGGDSSPAMTGEYNADTTLVLLDNVGRLWYIDEIACMTEGENLYGEAGYIKDDGSYVSENSYGYGATVDNVFTLEYEGESGSTYSVFVIREVVETPLYDMFLNDELGITYHFSNIYYVGQFGAKDEVPYPATGDCPMFVFSLYDYWNYASENQFYLYIQDRTKTDQYDSSWNYIYTKGSLYDLGNLGTGYMVSTIYSAEYEGGIVETSIPVTFKPGDGVTGDDQVIYCSPEDFTLPNEYDIMDFGWNVPENMALDYWSIAGEDEPVNVWDIELTAGLVFEAHWKTKIGVTYLPGDATDNSEVTVYYSDSTFSLPSEWEITYDPFWWTVPEGMAFAGWLDSNGEPVTELYDITLEEGLTYTASWSKLTEVKFNPGEDGEAKGFKAGSLYFSGDTFELPTQYGLSGLGWRPIPDNYTLTGWKNDQTGEIVKPGAAAPLSEGLSYTAQWEVRALSSDTSIESIYYNYVVTEPTFSRTQYDATKNDDDSWTLKLPSGVPIPEETYSIIVNPTDENAVCDSWDDIADKGDGVFEITVHAEDGTTADYTLTVIVEE